MDLQEVDIQSPDNDHLGDYVEAQSPYPSSEAAQRIVVPRGDLYADPATIRDDFAVYGAATHKMGTLVRTLTPDEWSANGFLLSDGRNAFQIAERDPQRARLVIVNHSTGNVFVAPTPTETVGWGACFVPPDGGSVELLTSAPVWLFTQSDYLHGGVPVHVQVIAERWS